MPPLEAADVPLLSSPLAEEVVSLFDQLRQPLLRYALSLGLPIQDGEEVVQETFLALFRHLRQGQPRANLRAWVFRVAHNLALKRHRGRAAFQDMAQAIAASEALFTDPGPNPEDQMLSAQKRRRALAVVSALPEHDRRCLFLRAEGLRYREIARVLGSSLGAVSLSLSRTLARLERAAQR